MSTRINIKGHRYGALTVIEFSHVHGGHACWLCSCDCGGKKIISSNSLRTGATRSCGCFSWIKVIDLVSRSCRAYFLPRNIAEPDEIERHELENLVKPSGFDHNW